MYKYLLGHAHAHTYGEGGNGVGVKEGEMDGVCAWEEQPRMDGDECEM